MDKELTVLVERLKRVFPDLVLYNEGHYIDINENDYYFRYCSFLIKHDNYFYEIVIDNFYEENNITLLKSKYKNNRFSVSFEIILDIKKEHLISIKDNLPEKFLELFNILRQEFPVL